MMASSRAAAPPRMRPVKTALHQAVLDGRLHQARLLVTGSPSSVDCKDMFGRTPLMLACLLDNPDYGFKMVKIFLKAGAYPNVRDNLARTALSYAAMKGRAAIVMHLLKEDILDIGQPDNDGNTPLHHAALSGSPDIVRELAQLMIRFGTSVDSRNRLGYTPLLLACKYAHYVSAYVLLTMGLASPTLRDNEFFLNAADWVVRSTELQAALLRQRGPMAPVISRFQRENTLYRQGSSYVPVCRHFQAPAHPLGQSLDSALRLPAVFGYFPLEVPSEQELDGTEARQVLLSAIEEQIRRPASRVSGVWPARRPAPTTPKLAELAPRRGSDSNMVPDMKTLFKMYSDQYDARTARDKPTILMSPSTSIDRQASYGNESTMTGNMEPSPITA